MTGNEIDNLFSYHPATAVTGDLHDQVRTKIRNCAKAVKRLTPDSPEQAIALRKLQEAMMYANSAIACHSEPARTSAPLVGAATVKVEKAKGVRRRKTAAA